MRISCPYCKTVNAICFWGPMPEKPWKRPVLLVTSILGGAGFGFILWLAWSKATSAFFLLLAALLVALSVLGAFVALRGCNACVARFFGSL